MSAETLSPEELASLLGVSERTVRDLAKRGHVRKATRGRYHLAASVTAYCAHLRSIAAGRGGDDQVATLTAERARLAKEQADAAALKNAALRGTMVAAVEVEREWSDVMKTLCRSLMNIPSIIQQAIPNIPQSEVLKIDALVRYSLDQASCL